MNWKPVIGFEGLYEVSDTGLVRSLERIDSLGRPLKERILKGDTDKDGYKRVSLFKEGRSKKFFVHYLVMLCFKGGRPEGSQVCHKDGTKTNNNVKNLRYGTAKENAMDRESHRVSDHPNVFRDPKTKKWLLVKVLGAYNTEEEAIEQGTNHHCILD